MKTKEFIRGLLRDGCVFLRHGSNHDVYFNPLTAQKQPVPRHAKIDDALAKHIRRRLGLS
jgi:predicted RNA binding protein YcfA (HicA-like mRNA interferase family)